MEQTSPRPEEYADQESYFLAAEDQRVFGAGIKRKRVPFVSASTLDTSSVAKPSSAVADKYLSMVLKQQEQTSSPPADDIKPVACEICGQPVNESHESSISHQLCLEHSHPPSHLPRENVGLKILGSQGWDPDSRLGLGATGDGIRVPIKGKVKNDTIGIGMEIQQSRKNNPLKTRNERGLKRLNAKEVREQEEASRKRAQKLQQNFYGQDLSKYLGPDG